MATLLHLLPLALLLSFAVAFVPPQPDILPLRRTSIHFSDAAPHSPRCSPFPSPCSIRTRLYTFSTANDSKEDIPVDSASTTAQLLAALWTLISQASSTMIKGETKTILFPNMKAMFSPSYLTKLMGHLDVCKDVCDYFGTKTVLLPFIQDNIVEGFIVKSYRNPNKMMVMNMNLTMIPFGTMETIGIMKVSMPKWKEYYMLPTTRIGIEYRIMTMRLFKPPKRGSTK